MTRPKTQLDLRARRRIAAAVWLGLLALTATVFAEETAAVCERIPFVQEIPLKPDLPVDDPVYNQLLELGMEASPCLIDQVGNNLMMQSPLSTPTGPLVAVGDIAFFIWLNITGATMEEVLPPAVLEELEERGVFAYYGYVGAPGNRRDLQARMRAWVDEHR